MFCSYSWAILIYQSSYLLITLDSGFRKKPFFLGNEAKWWCWQGSGEKTDGAAGGGATSEEVLTYEIFMGHNQLLWLKTQAQFSGIFSKKSLVLLEANYGSFSACSQNSMDLSEE